jgi:S-(hydroxymethyl)glutathione dehydrogenase/alcohol dehydrogenase
MKAALYVEVDQPLSIEDVTPLDPGPRDLVVRMTASGVCHSDLSMMNGTMRLRDSTILGHEGAGVVDWVGPEVAGIKPGDRVIGSFIPACGSCWYCLNHQSNLCEHTNDWLKVPRVTRAGGDHAMCMTGLGTFAESMTVDQMNVVRIETDLPDEQLALIGCGVTTGVGAALNTARIVPGSTVAVMGCGGVGQSVIQGARIAGASRIIAIDPVPLKREAALRLGATDVIDPTEGTTLDQVRALTGGRGVDYSFEVIGLPETVAQAFDLARNGGACIAVGMLNYKAKVEIPSFPLVLGEKRLLGCVYGSAQVRRDFPRLVSLVESGKLDLGSMVSRTVHLDDVNDALRAMQAGEVIRSVIV